MSDCVKLAVNLRETHIMKTRTFYPVTVKFTKYHTTGILKGFDIIDEIGFPTLYSAEKWIRDLRKNTKIENLKYLRTEII